MNFVKNFWLGLSDTTRDHVVSAVRTFVATFVVMSASIVVAAGIENFSKALLISAVTAGVNAGFKSLLQAFAPVSLGGKK